jgi:hypothetical protein
MSATPVRALVLTFVLAAIALVGMTVFALGQLTPPPRPVPPQPVPIFVPTPPAASEMIAARPSTAATPAPTARRPRREHPGTERPVTKVVTCNRETDPLCGLGPL